jgi:hypothetical protein
LEECHGNSFVSQWAKLKINRANFVLCAHARPWQERQ